MLYNERERNSIQYKHFSKQLLLKNLHFIVLSWTVWYRFPFSICLYCLYTLLDEDVCSWSLSHLLYNIRSCTIYCSILYYIHSIYSYIHFTYIRSGNSISAYRSSNIFKHFLVKLIADHFIGVYILYTIQYTAKYMYSTMHMFQCTVLYSIYWDAHAR